MNIVLSDHPTIELHHFGSEEVETVEMVTSLAAVPFRGTRAVTVDSLVLRRDKLDKEYHEEIRTTFQNIGTIRVKSTN